MNLKLFNNIISHLLVFADLNSRLPVLINNYPKSKGMAPEQIEALPSSERKALKNKVTHAIELAIEKAKKIAQEQRPITAPMEEIE